MMLTWLGAILGCSSGEGAATQEVVPEVEPVAERPNLHEFGWISEVVLDPAAFGTLTQGASRDGWIALHAHDYRGSIRAFADQEDARARGEFALALFYDDLSAASGVAHDQLFTEWQARTTLPEGNDVVLLASLASYCSDGDTTVSWAQKITDGPGLPIARALMQGRSPFDVSSADPFGRRLAVHQRARNESPDETPLLELSAEPVVTRDEGDFVRKFWDPCLHRTLSEYWLRASVMSLRGSSWRAIDRWAADDVGLAGRVFAAWPSADDLKSEAQTAEAPGLVGSRTPLLRKLGVGTEAVTGDTAQQAQEEVRVLDAGLDGWRKQLREGATDDGRALLEDLGLVDRFRQEWLVTRARLALRNDRPQLALTFLDLAHDPSAELGVANSPSLFALLARAQLQVGRTREALIALQKLEAFAPEVLGLREVVGDLAVLRGLDRVGVGRESQ